MTETMAGTLMVTVTETMMFPDKETVTVTLTWTRTEKMAKTSMDTGMVT